MSRAILRLLAVWVIRTSDEKARSQLLFVFGLIPRGLSNRNGSDNKNVYKPHHP